MEKGKAECENSPTLNDQDVREMLGKVVCNGEYDEKQRDQICEFELQINEKVMLQRDQ